MKTLLVALVLVCGGGEGVPACPTIKNEAECREEPYCFWHKMEEKCLDNDSVPEEK